MSGYSATMIVKGLNGSVMTGGGSFANINIDGRLSMQSAIEVARKTFTMECKFKKCDYLGFAIEKTTKFVEYCNPNMVDTDIKAKDVEYLL